MNSNWTTLLAALGAQNIAPEDAAFAPAGADSLQPDAQLIPLPYLGVMTCSGEDSAEFLHNQLTSDVRHLTPNSGQLTTWCTAKGRMICSGLLIHTGQNDKISRYSLLLAADLASAVAQRLKMFILRSRTVIEDHSAEQLVFGLSGPKAAKILAQAGLPAPEIDLAAASRAETIVIRLAENRFQLVIAAARAAEMCQALQNAGAVPAGSISWRIQDIEAGIPLITAATREELVPQMADFDRINGVSFHKGCYPGQEVVARTQYLGRVKRRLFRLEADEAMQAGILLFSPGSTDPEHACGIVINAAETMPGHYIALAVLMENVLQAQVHLQSLEGKSVRVSTIARPE